MSTVAQIKAKVTYPWLKEFISDDPEAFLGDAMRHIEPGEIFPEEYSDITGPNQDLGPKSGWPMNLITETDRDIIKWHIRTSHNLHDFASYFFSYSTFSQFMNLLKGTLMKGINKSLAAIVKAVMTSDPSATSFDDVQFARIFGKTSSPRGGVVGVRGQPASQLAEKYNTMMKKLINKYSDKSRHLWKNITFYNPYNFSHTGAYEGLNKAYIYSAAAEKDELTAETQMEHIYTDAHGNAASLPNRTERITDINRYDSLFALFDAIVKALLVLTTEESHRFWLGNDPLVQIMRDFQSNKQKLQALKALYPITASLVDGTPIQEGDTAPDNQHTTTASSDDNFEVSANAEDLILLLNPEDYADLEVGAARRGQMDVRSINLDMLRSKVGSIYPMRGMKPGFARLIDKRAFKILPYFQMTNVQEPMEVLAWRYKTFYQFAVVMFKNFAGTLFVPSPHFIQDATTYDRYDLHYNDIKKPLPSTGATSPHKPSSS